METARELETLITCSVCFEIYAKPCVLTCLHTFCSDCIQKIRIKGSVVCPECRAYSCNEDIKMDFRTQALIDLHQKSDPSPASPPPGFKPCDTCESHVKVIQTKCVVCDQYMCSDCERVHNKMASTKDHQMMSVNEVVNSLTAKLEDAKTDLVKGQQVIQMHSQGSETIAKQIVAAKDSHLQKLREYQEEYIADIKNHHERLMQIIEEKANEVIEELESYKCQNSDVEREIRRRVDFLEMSGSSRDITKLTEIVNGIGDTFTEDVNLYKSNLPDLNKSLPVKLVHGDRLASQNLTKILVTHNPNVQSKSIAAIGKLSHVAGNEYTILKKTNHSCGITMKLELFGHHLWSAAYNDGVYVYDHEGQIIQHITNKFMKSACGVTKAHNGDIIIACGEHHDLLRYDSQVTYMGRITSGSFCDVYSFKQHIYTLDYDRCMVLVFDFNPSSNKWFCFNHWKLECYSYGHYCDKLVVNDTGIYISSYNNHCIYVLNHSGRVLFKIGTEGSGEQAGTFQGLILCDIDHKGNILACDRITHTIQVYQRSISQWSMMKVRGKEQILYPTDVAVNESGDTIWVATGQREIVKLHLIT